MTGLGHDPRSTAENVLAQIKLGEDSRVSVKEAHFDQKRVSAPRGESVANELAAFANARDGTFDIQRFWRRGASEHWTGARWTP